MNDERLKEFVEASFLKPLLFKKGVTDISYNGEELFYETNLEGRKKARGIEPSFATASEFRAELQGDMEGVMLELEEAGKIHRGPTLNDDYIALI